MTGPKSSTFKTYIVTHIGEPYLKVYVLPFKLCFDAMITYVQGLFVEFQPQPYTFKNTY